MKSQSPHLCLDELPLKRLFSSFSLLRFGNKAKDPPGGFSAVIPLTTHMSSNTLRRQLGSLYHSKLSFSLLISDPDRHPNIGQTQ